jgi:uroporphyrin-III C-methyltransferase
MLFGRAQEEIDALDDAGVRYEVVPGVTAALAASADLGISLTRRGVSRSVAFVTPRTGEGEARGNWVRAASAADTAVIYMGAGEADAISRALIESGRPAATPAVIVENASLPGESRHFTTLAGLAEAASASGSGPALILIGEVYGEAAALTMTAEVRQARAA